VRLAVALYLSKYGAFGVSEDYYLNSLLLSVMRDVKLLQLQYVLQDWKAGGHVLSEFLQ
jgi:hypothetical protein